MTSREPFITGVGSVRTSIPGLMDPEPVSPQRLLDAATEITKLVADAARRAWDSAGLVPTDGAGTECCLGTAYGTGHVGEYYARSFLSQKRPSLNPRAFPLSCLNAGAASVTRALGLSGASITLTGCTSGVDALIHSVRTLALGRANRVVCGGFDWPSRLGARLLAAAGTEVDPSDGGAVIFVMEAEDVVVAGRGVQLSAVDLERLVRRPPAGGGGRLSPTVAPLLSVAEELQRHHRPAAPTHDSPAVPQTAGAP